MQLRVKLWRAADGAGNLETRLRRGMSIQARDGANLAVLEGIVRATMAGWDALVESIRTDA